MLLSCRVVEFAVLGRNVKYSGHSHLYSDGKEVGPVPKLAVVEPLDGGEPMLLHCGRDWTVLGIAGFPSVKAAKQRAERTYPGVSNQWTKTRVSKAQANAYLTKLWKGVKSSFCARRPDQLNSLIGKGSVRICDICVREFHEDLGGR